MRSTKTGAGSCSNCSAWAWVWTGIPTTRRRTSGRPPGPSPAGRSRRRRRAATITGGTGNSSTSRKITMMAKRRSSAIPATSMSRISSTLLCSNRPVTDLLPAICTTSLLPMTCWHLHVIGNKEVVQMAGNKSVTGRLLHNNVDDILDIEVAGMAEERLFAIIVIFLDVLEFPVPPVIVAARRRLRDRPAGEGPGGLPDVRLRVVGMPVHTHAQAEQFEQLPAPVFVDRIAVVVTVIQPVNHGRVLGQRNQQVAIVTHALLAEHVGLVDEFVPVIDLRLAGGEHLVPEQHHLLLQRPFRG